MDTGSFGGHVKKTNASVTHEVGVNSCKLANNGWTAHDGGEREEGSEASAWLVWKAALTNKRGGCIQFPHSPIQLQVDCMHCAPRIVDHSALLMTIS